MIEWRENPKKPRKIWQSGTWQTKGGGKCNRNERKGTLLIKNAIAQLTRSSHSSKA